MLLKRSIKYVGNGPLMLAKLTHKYEGVDDVEFLAIQDAVESLTSVEREMYRRHYIDLFKRKITF